MKIKNGLIVITAIMFNPVYACECLVLSGAVETTQRYSKGATISPCDTPLEAVSSKAEVCLFKIEGDVKCYEVHQSESPLNPTDKNCSNKNATTDTDMRKGFFETLLAMWAPGTDNNYGGLNLKDAEYLEGFPYGDILLPSSPLILNSTPSPLPVEAFSVREESSASALSFRQDGNAIHINSTAFEPDHTYIWLLTSAGKQYEGSFTIAFREDQQDYEEELNDIIAQQHLAGTARLIAAARLAQQYGYTFDYQQYLATAKQQLSD